MILDEQSPSSPTSPLAMIEFCTQPSSHVSASLKSTAADISTTINEISLHQLSLSVQEKERASSAQSPAKHTTVTNRKSSTRSRSSSSLPIVMDKSSNQRDDDDSSIIHFQMKRSERIICRTRPRRTLSNNDVLKVFKQQPVTSTPQPVTSSTPISTQTRSRRTKRYKSEIAAATHCSGKRGSSSRSLNSSNMMGENSLRDLYDDMKASPKQRSSLAPARPLLLDRKNNSNKSMSSSSSHSESSTSTYSSDDDLARSNKHHCPTETEPPPAVPTPTPVLVTSALWKCTCGFEHEDRMRFCGVCGTKKHWSCRECQFEENLCLYVFCGMCGVRRHGKTTVVKAPTEDQEPPQLVPVTDGASRRLARSFKSP